jgi:hypothetical protein
MKQTLGCPVQGTVFITLHSRPQEEAWEEAPRKGCRQGVKLNPSLQGNIPVPIRIIRLWFLGWSNTPKRCFLTLLAARELFFFFKSSILTRHDISSMKFTIQSSNTAFWKIHHFCWIFQHFPRFFPWFSQDFSFLDRGFPRSSKKPKNWRRKKRCLGTNQWSTQQPMKQTRPAFLLKKVEGF